MNKLYLGTAGWSYDDWVKVFYPQKQSKEFDYLKFYAKYFNVVEVNSTYYTYIYPNVAQSWINKVEVNPDFTFIIKTHQDFTHKKNITNENIKKFIGAIDVLNKSDMLAGILLQFPYSFNFNSSNLEYLKKLNEIFSGYDQFLEVRHSTWINAEAIGFCSDANISLCSIDQPQLGKSIDFSINLTSDNAYIRMHGRNTEAWKSSIQNFGKEQTYQEQNERYNYLYTPGELIEISNKIKEIYDKVKQVYVIMNNHPSGKAVINAFELLHLLDLDKKLDIPETTINSNSRIKKIAG